MMAARVGGTLPTHVLRRALCAASAAQTGDTMRQVHWNLRRCVDPATGTNSTARVLACIKNLEPTVLTLNEVDISMTPTLFEEFAALGLRHQSFFGHVREGQYGNALLSTLPLERVTHTHLDGGTVVLKRDGTKHRIARGMLSASINAFGVSTRLSVTHLDHMSAEQRRVQMAHVLRTMTDEAAASEPTILVGDLNALSRRDYTAAQWGAHEAHNAAKGWGPPVDDAAEDGSLGLLASSGFVDAFYSLLSPRGGGEWATPPWTAHARVPDGPRYRIDYVWSRAPTEARSGLVARAACVERDCGGASDHQPIVIEWGG